MCYQTEPLTKEMLSDLLALEQACFATPWTEGMFLGELNNSATIYRVVTQKGCPVAYMGMWCVADEGQITNVAVHPHHRRRGLAIGLIRLFIEMAKEKGLHLLTLEVRTGNKEAIALYEKMGFIRVGCRRGYYEHGEDALLMTLFLAEGKG
ncbi:MAG: ribosomal-protein-alanine N-acetyltransferase [Ruminococcaceae bacterium]|nr:ribosomal-protein-alanine N-acetyltransferase [Oscillospiraceae bacterium]